MKLYVDWVMTRWKLLVFVLTPLVLMPLPIIDQTGVGAGAYSGLIMAVYWVFEILPLAVTSLIPIVLFPLFNIMPTSEVTKFYMKDTIVLYLGGKSNYTIFLYSAKAHK